MSTELSGSEMGESTQVSKRPPLPGSELSSGPQPPALPESASSAAQELSDPHGIPSGSPSTVVDQVAPAGEAGTEDEVGGEPESQPDDSRGNKFLLLNAVPSWLVSLVVHSVGLLVLALIMLPLEQETRLTMVSPGDANQQVEEFELEEFEPLEVQELVTEAVVAVPNETTSEPNMPAVDDLDPPAAMQVELVDVSSRVAPKSDLMATIGAATGTGLSGRSDAMRKQLATKMGATKGSEAAVARALKWLALHQLPNGAWSFDHRPSPACRGKCRNQGSLGTSFNGATAMGLLPFLGAGQTHQEGKYRRVVEKGLYFLSTNMKVRPGPRGELSDAGGRMYSHGLASIALCEAYAMTNDQSLLQPAQYALNHIVYAQDPVGGGWRYSAKQPGDTSAVGWQLMALKSGHMGYLMVPPQTVAKASMFLDAVSMQSGAFYGYTSPGRGAATTAVGLLCRMYLGWGKDQPGLQRGVEYLSKTGPLKSNMYYNYYATQVLRHWEGPEWTKWNTEMRDWLVDSQTQRGHENGSWFIGGGHSGQGGRLYCTAMATMILEVYYRHMPIYRKQAAEEDFPL